MEPMDVDCALMGFEPTGGAERADGDLTSEDLPPPRSAAARSPQRRPSTNRAIWCAEIDGSLATSGQTTLHWTHQ
jgi:hypothetical protein